MKQQDWTTIIIVVFISGIVSLLAAKYIFASPKNRQQTVEVVPIISADFPKPDINYFNTQAVDPTQLIQIGNSTNPTPFNSPAH